MLWTNFGEKSLIKYELIKQVKCIVWSKSNQKKIYTYVPKICVNDLLNISYLVPMIVRKLLSSEEMK